MSVFSGLLLFAGFQLIAAQTPALLPIDPSPEAGIPAECLGPPPNVVDPLTCCKSPQFISRNSFMECGMQELENEHSPASLADWNVLLQAPEYEPENVRRPRFQENNNMQALPDVINIPGFQGRRFGQDIVQDCTKQHCILRKNEMMNGDKIDYIAVQNMLSVYAQANPETADAILRIKSKCFDTKLPGPTFMCEADKLFFCITSTFFYNCPHWQESPECHALISHLEKCKPYMPFAYKK